MDRNIQEMDLKQIAELGDEIAHYLSQESHWDVETVMQNLNVLEVILAVHHYFDMTNDTILFDQKRQSVVHDLLMQSESSDKDDLHGALAQALAIAKTRRGKTIVLMNDHAFNRGETYEALVEIAKEKPNLLIILIDEQESLLRHITSVDVLIKNIRISKAYTNFKTDMKQALDNPVSRPLLGTLTWIRDQVKETVLEPSIFTQFGINYHGPIDGQNLKEVMKIFALAQSFTGTHVIHVQTRLKGSKKRKIEFPKYKTDQAKPEGYLSTLEHLDRYLLKEDAKNLVVLSDGLSLSEHLLHFSQAKPKQYYTVSGSSFALVDMAYGFAKENKEVLMLISAKRFAHVAVKLQRYFDQSEHVTVIVYEAGLSRYDRQVHAAVYDMNAYLNFKSSVYMAKNAQDLLQLLGQKDNAFKIIRVAHLLEPKKEQSLFPTQVWQEIKPIDHNSKAVILSFGPQVEALASKININDLPYGLVETQTINQIDETIMQKIIFYRLPIYIYNIEGDFDILSNHIKSYLFDKNIWVPLTSMTLAGVDYKLSSKELKNKYHLHLDDFFKLIKEA